MTKDETITLMLETLVEHGSAYLGRYEQYQYAITKGKEALAQQEQETDVGKLVTKEVSLPEQETDWEGIAADQALTIALMKSEQEPVYLIWNDWDTRWEIGRKQTYDDTSEENRWLLYTSPPKREWVGLTDEQALKQITAGDAPYRVLCGAKELLVYAHAIEAKLKELNHENKAFNNCI